MNYLKKIIAAASILSAISFAAYAQVSIWGATDRGPVSGTYRIPVDTSSSSTPGYITATEISTFIGAVTPTSTNTLTNKTFDTSGTGNVFKAAGTTITGAQGNGAKLQLSTGSTTTGDCVQFDANGNTTDAGAACGTGGGGGTVTSSGSPSAGNIPKFTTATNIAPAAASDIIALFSTCSGSQYLGADGACHSASGSGTVTSVATNNGLTGGPVTTSGTIGLASISNNSVLCNNSGSSAVPTSANCTVTGTGNAVLATSPTLTTAVLGSSTATTQSAADNSTKVATTAYVDRSNLKARNVTVGFDGGGQALTAGKIVYLANSPCTGTIQSVTMLADQSGSAVVDVWKVAYASAPPTVSNTITASDLPTLSSAQKSTDSTLTGWTKSVTDGDTWAFKLNSSSTITTLSLVIRLNCT